MMEYRARHTHGRDDDPGTVCIYSDVMLCQFERYQDVSLNFFDAFKQEKGLPSDWVRPLTPNFEAL